MKTIALLTAVSYRLLAAAAQRAGKRNATLAPLLDDQAASLKALASHVSERADFFRRRDLGLTAGFPSRPFGSLGPEADSAADLIIQWLCESPQAPQTHPTGGAQVCRSPRKTNRRAQPPKSKKAHQ